MAVIPAGVFRLVEWHLHHENDLVAVAAKRRKEAIDDALHGCGLLCDGQPRGKGGHSEPAASRAMAIVKAGEEVEKAREWVRAIRQTYDYFDDTAVFKMAVSYYGRGVTIRALADLLGTNEKTLDRQRDKFVSTCALFAAEKGLVKADYKLE
jgi:hypothetical protein